MAGGDEMEIFPSLKPNKLDRRNKAQKHSPLQMEELAEFLEGINRVMEAIIKLTDRMIPIFTAERKKLAEKVEALKRKASALVQARKDQQAQKDS